MDEHDAVRAAIEQTRRLEGERRAQTEGLMAEVRSAFDGDPISVRMFECLAVERALLDALARNTEAMSRVLDDSET